MSFLDEFRKFLGGIAGDERTNSGIAINQGQWGKLDETKARVIPFTYTDDNETIKSGFMKVPETAAHDLNSRLDKQDNSEAIELVGIELADGTKLDYNKAKSFLNRHTPQTLKITSSYNPDWNVNNRAFMDSLRVSMNSGTQNSPRKLRSDGFIDRDNLRDFYIKGF